MDGWIGPRDAHTSACGKGEGRGGCSDANGVLRARPRMDGRCGGGEQPRGLWIDSICCPVSTDPPARCTGRGRTSQAPSARTRHGRARENGRRCCSLLACCLLPAHTHMRTPQAGGRGEQGGGRRAVLAGCCRSGRSVFDQAGSARPRGIRGTDGQWRRDCNNVSTTPARCKMAPRACCITAMSQAARSNPARRPPAALWSPAEQWAPVLPGQLAMGAAQLSPGSSGAKGPGDSDATC